MISFEFETKKLRIELRPNSLKPTVAMELLNEAYALIESKVSKELKKVAPKDEDTSNKKVDYIA
jgi:hypothetical protein